MKPLPLIKAAYLDTQNGIRNKRNTTQKLFLRPGSCVEKFNAIPINTLMPTDDIHSKGNGSK